MQALVTSTAGAKVSWSVVPGATSYTLERSAGNCLGTLEAVAFPVSGSSRT
jgi:hypothetical protein